MAYRLLTKEEIRLLLSQGCFADKWTDISVTEKFSPKNIRNTRFEGKIKLGFFHGKIKVKKGNSRNSGIYNSYIRHCEIADNVYISETNTYQITSLTKMLSLKILVHWLYRKNLLLETELRLKF